MSSSRKYNRIKVELTEAGKQNGELAVFLDVHPSTVSDWCTNTNQPSIQYLYKIAEFLKIDVRRLLVPNHVRLDAYSIEPESFLMVAEDEAPYNRKPKPAKATGKPKPKGKKPR
ncbi:MAG TPA: helix-turn-helix transcriptional regulator [Chitinophagaceae bacterium]|jgi:transcriptional regulator with XRE-family HTH domain